MFPISCRTRPLGYVKDLHDLGHYTTHYRLCIKHKLSFQSYLLIILYSQEYTNIRVTNSNIGGHTGKSPYVCSSTYATDLMILRSQDLGKVQVLPLLAEHVAPTSSILFPHAISLHHAIIEIQIRPRPIPWRIQRKRLARLGRLIIHNQQV